MFRSEEASSVASVASEPEHVVFNEYLNARGYAWSYHCLPKEKLLFSEEARTGTSRLRTTGRPSITFQACSCGSVSVRASC